MLLEREKHLYMIWGFGEPSARHRSWAVWPDSTLISLTSVCTVGFTGKFELRDTNLRTDRYLQRPPEWLRMMIRQCCAPDTYNCPRRHFPKYRWSLNVLVHWCDDEWPEGIVRGIDHQTTNQFTGWLSLNHRMLGEVWSITWQINSIVSPGAASTRDWLRDIIGSSTRRFARRDLDRNGLNLPA